MKRITAFILIVIMSFGGISIKGGCTAYASESYTMNVGETLTLKPYSTDDRVLKTNGYTWTINNNTSYLSIVDSGISYCKIEALKSYSGRLAVNFNYYYYITSGTYTYAVQVSDVFYITIESADPTGIALSSTSKSMTVGDTSTLTATVSPSNAETTLTWSSSNTSAATVSSGTITAVGVGTAVITVTISNGLSASCTVTVTAPALSLSSSSPADNSTRISTNAAIKLTFNTTLAKGSKFSSIGLNDETSAETVSQTAGISGKVLSIVPDSELETGHKYVITVPSGSLENASGAALASSITITFTTREVSASSTMPESIDGIYQIGTVNELYGFEEYVNEGNVSANAVLIADIVVNDDNVAGYDGTSENDWIEWVPIGYYNSSSDYVKYAGTFDGQGHTVSGLYFNNSSVSYVGLFGYTASDAEISNVGIENSYICGYDIIGSITGYNYYGKIENCYNNGIVIGTKTGGLCGYNYYGTITDCYNTGSVSGSGNDVGGIVGVHRKGTITNCHNSGEISGTSYVGGISGENYQSGSTIIGCCNTGSVVGSSKYTGGISGYSNSGTIESSCNTGSISGSNYIGGVCGYNSNSSAAIASCYNIGNVSSSGGYAGGICGYKSSGTITSCYYLEGTADGGINGSDSSGSAEAKTASEFAGGEAAWLLNGETDEYSVGWYQNIDNGQEADAYPVLDSTHGTVYKVLIGDISGYSYSYSNINNVSGSPKTDSNGIYQIGTKDELYWFASYVNIVNSSANAVLIADITVNAGDVAGYDGTSENDWTEWITIGYYNSSSDYVKYAGTFDGQGHTVSGLYFNDSSVSYVGLFGRIGSGGKISNVGIENSYFNGYKYVGGISGYNQSGTIESCYNAGNISGSNAVGGVCGYNSGGTIESCYNAGYISGSNDIGGVNGASSGTTENCYNIGEVSGSVYVGGVSGSSSGTITNCCNAGNVVSSSIYTGGVSGYNSNGTIESCYNTGSVSSSGNHTGGVCGFSYGIIKNCYNTGSISGSIYAGGVCGCLGGYNGEYYGSMTSCYSTGSISGSSYVGGVSGLKNSSCTMTNCYYLDSTADGGIDGSDSSGSAVAKTEAQFESGQVCYLLNGSSSSSPIWYQTIGSDSYPLLSGARIVYYTASLGYYNNIILGDVNMDECITKLDAVIILKYVSGIISESEFAEQYDTEMADVSGDGEINIIDVNEILKLV